ncbi:hypothetical protein PENSPDRAFT_752749 [Peniophora sp. CONT]|nr:hypothetical protein PENSPDRAFT_752749 [Peniophora sp. CONT]
MVDGRVLPSTRMDALASKLWHPSQLDTRPQMPPPLLTPSATPPASRYPDQPSPTKRPRLSPSASSTTSVSAGSEPITAVRDPVRDEEARRAKEAARLARVEERQRADREFEKERLASVQRLQDRWAALAERYTRALDEDDIIDLRTITITRDRGVVRNTTQPTAFGELSGVEEEEDDGAQTEAEGEVEGDESEDELEVADVLAPVQRTRDPFDDEDLREFMDAEKERKELYGDDDDATDSDDSLDVPLASISRPASPVPGPSRPAPQRRRPPDDDEDEDEESEDELGAWANDESTAIYRIRDTRPVARDSSPSLPATSPSPSAPSSPSPTPAYLPIQTPRAKKKFVPPPGTEIIEIEDDSPPSSPRMPSSDAPLPPSSPLPSSSPPPMSDTDFSSPTPFDFGFASSSKVSRPFQLVTPPESFASASSDVEASSSMPTRPRPRPVLKERMTVPIASTSTSSESLAGSSIKTPRPMRKAEVLLNRRIVPALSSPLTSSSSSIAPSTPSLSPRKPSPGPRLPRPLPSLLDKGKQRAIEPPAQPHRAKSTALPPSTSISTSSFYSQPQPQSSRTRPDSPPMKIGPPRGRSRSRPASPSATAKKRKRVSSVPDPPPELVAGSSRSGPEEDSERGRNADKDTDKRRGRSVSRATRAPNRPPARDSTSPRRTDERAATRALSRARSKSRGPASVPPPPLPAAFPTSAPAPALKRPVGRPPKSSAGSSKSKPPPATRNPATTKPPPPPDAAGFNALFANGLTPEAGMQAHAILANAMQQLSALMGTPGPEDVEVEEEEVRGRGGKGRGRSNASLSHDAAIVDSREVARLNMLNVQEDIPAQAATRADILDFKASMNAWVAVLQEGLRELTAELAVIRTEAAANNAAISTAIRTDTAAIRADIAANNVAMRADIAAFRVERAADMASALRNDLTTARADWTAARIDSAAVRADVAVIGTTIADLTGSIERHIVTSNNVLINDQAVPDSE